MWPDAVIVADTRDYIIEVPGRAPKRPSKRRLADIVAENTPDDDAPYASLARFGDGDVRIGLDSADEAWQQLGVWAYTALTALDAANYVEQMMQVTKPDGTRATLAVAACWSPQQSPHELRRTAETQRDEALAAADKLRAQLAAAGIDPTA